jgi:hypothetical protein
MKSITIPLLMIFLSTGCKKILSTQQSSNTHTNEEVFSNEQSANAIALNMYSDPMKSADILNGLLTRYLGLAADELQSPNGKLPESDLPWFNCAVSPSDKILQGFWSRPYEYIYQGNNIIESLRGNKKLRDPVKKTLTGEALFIRALSYFYLVNLYDGVPSISKTNFAENASLPRESRDSIYKLIINDLKLAEQNLPEYSPGGDSALKKGTRATKWAAKALLARAYLYTGQWEKSEQYAAALINSGQFVLENNLDNVFLVNSKEVLFQLQPVNKNQKHIEASYFLPNNKQAPLLVITSTLFNSFESGDLRRKNWIGNITVGNKTHYYPYKYKAKTSGQRLEYNVVMRMGEICLIHAEALAMQDKLDGAVESLRPIRVRAGLAPIPSGLTKQQILQRIEKERQAELFAEWGHRWLDLKRTKGFQHPDKPRAMEVLEPLKPSFQSYKLLFPIPARELQQNPRLVQNPLY